MAKEQSGFDVALAAVNRALGEDEGDTEDIEVDELDTDGEADETPDESDEGDEGGEGGDEEDGEADESDDEDADETDEQPEGEESDDDADETPDGEESDESQPDAEEVARAEEAARAATTDEFDKLLDELGFRAPKKGQRENKIPQSRVRARMKTALKKYAAQRDAGLTDINGKLTAAQARVEEMDRVEALIRSSDTNPENARQYISLLANLHPAFKAFLAEPQAPPVTGDAAVEAEIKKLGPKPGPDIDYKDGTFGYSPEQMEKREQWLQDVATIKAEARAVQRLNDRLTPFEQERKTAKQREEDAPRIAARLDALRKQWGPHFIADEKKGADKSEILAYQRANKCSFEDAVAAVILPKIVADRTKMRQEILAELKGKRGKVAKTAVQPTRRTVVKKTGPVSNTQVVHAKLKKLGL